MIMRQYRDSRKECCSMVEGLEKDMPGKIETLKEQRQRENEREGQRDKVQHAGEMLESFRGHRACGDTISVGGW